MLGVDPAFSGWLFKLGNPGRWNEGWRRRWFVLDGTQLVYYTAEDCTKKVGTRSK